MERGTAGVLARFTSASPDGATRPGEGSSTRFMPRSTRSPSPTGSAFGICRWSP